MMRKDEAKIEWLRAAAKESFDAIERGDYTALSSVDELNAYIIEVSKEVFGHAPNAKLHAAITAMPKKN